jgi:sulfoquinovosidase
VEWQFIECDDGFDLQFAGRLILRHRELCPALAMAHGEAKVLMHHGNFRIEDAPSQHCTPTGWRQSGDSVFLDHEGVEQARLFWTDAVLNVESLDPDCDRLWLSFHAEPDETVWGGGEQMS